MLLKVFVLVLQGGKAMSPNFVFSWPNAVRCADAPHNVMEAVKAVSVAMSPPSA